MNSKERPFPFISNMIECYGFDAVFGGGRLSNSTQVACKKGDGVCSIITCKKFGKPLPEVEVPEEKKSLDIFD